MTKLLVGRRSKHLITNNLIKVHQVLSTSCNGSDKETEDIQPFAGLNSDGQFLLNWSNL